MSCDRRQTYTQNRRWLSSDLPKHRRQNSPRRSFRPDAWTPRTENTFNCETCQFQCGTKNMLLHHELRTHEWNIPCFVCEKNCATFEYMVAHSKHRHPEHRVQCLFCKAYFGTTGELTDEGWRQFRHHLYGEVFYSRLAAITT